MKKKKVASLIVLGMYAGFVWACADEPAPTPPAANKPAPASNAPKTSNANTSNANAADTAVVVDMPADVAPIFQAKCSACHGKDAMGGPAAPRIVGAHEKHTAAEWIAYLKDPKVWKKKMPPVEATEDEFKKLGGWLEAKAAGSADPKAAGNSNAKPAAAPAKY